MRRRVFGITLFGLLFTLPMLAAPAVTRILLLARDLRDLEDHPLPGFRFTSGGFKSQSTDRVGATEPHPPSEHQTGQQIKIFLLAPGSKRTEKWFLLNAATWRKALRRMSTTSAEPEPVGMLTSGPDSKRAHRAAVV